MAFIGLYLQIAVASQIIKQDGFGSMTKEKKR
jgi:hypothetical protein